MAVIDEILRRVAPKVHYEVVTAKTIERHRKLDPKTRIGDTVKVVEDPVIDFGEMTQ